MLSSNRIHQLSLLFLTAFLPLLAWGGASPRQGKTVEVSLEGTVKVASEQVSLGDVATIYAENVENFSALSGLVVSRIPEDKDSIHIPREYLESRIRSALPPSTGFVLKAPEDILFKIERGNIRAESFSREIERIAREGGKVSADAELEVVLLNGLDRLKGFSVGKIRIEPQSEMVRWRGDISFKVSNSDGLSTPVWVRARIRCFEKAWMAVRPLAFGEQLDPSFFKLGRTETTNLREVPFSGSLEDLQQVLKGSRLKRSLSANAALLPGMLDRKPDAAPGSSLRVEFISESGIRVSAEGLLMSPGIIGGDVKARLKSSKKLVTGKLVSQGLVEVAL